MMHVRSLDHAVPEERAQWVAWWEAWPDREVFAHPHYVELFARPGDRVLCAGRRTDSGGVLFPFLLRPLTAEPWSDPAETAWDLVGPYGYGGAFAWNYSADQAAEFWKQVEDWLREHAVVSSFVRLSLFPDQLLAFPGTVELNAPNVVRSLDLTPDELWHAYEHKVRKNVNRAKQSQLAVEIDPAGRRLDEFLAIYYSTLDRREASGTYFFPREFFAALVRNLAGQFVFVHILHNQQVVSSELVLVSARHVYSFLGGTLAEAFPLRPNDLLKHEVILWARQLGKRAFVLGGGYGGEDGIYRYKKSFAPQGSVDFLVGKAIHDRAGYERLLARRRDWETQQGNPWQPKPGYFPEYRA
jgi:hypothetical protein